MWKDFFLRTPVFDWKAFTDEWWKKKENVFSLNIVFSYIYAHIPMDLSVGVSWQLIQCVDYPRKACGHAALKLMVSYSRLQGSASAHPAVLCRAVCCGSVPTVPSAQRARGARCLWAAPGTSAVWGGCATAPVCYNACLSPLPYGRALRKTNLTNCPLKHSFYFPLV